MKRKSLIKNRNFLLLWAGQILSQAGSKMYIIAIMWWVLTSASENIGLHIGIFMVSTALPPLMLVKFIGKFVDERSIRRILVGFEFLAFLFTMLIGFLLFYNLMTLNIAYLAGFVLATFQGFIDPGLNKALPEIVEKEDMDSAVSKMTSTQSMAAFLGAMLGALTIDWIGITGVVFLNAASYLISSVCATFIKFSPHEKKKNADETNNGNKTTLAGFKLLNPYPLVKKILIGFGFVNFFMTPIFVVLPIYTSKILNEGAWAVALLEGGLSLGLLAGTFCANYFKFIKNDLSLATICLFVLGMGMIIPGVYTSLYLYLVTLTILGFALGVNNVRFIGMFHRIIPNEIKGKFFALFQAIISFTFPIAFFLFGILTDIFTTKTVLIIQGIGIWSLMIYFFHLSGKNEQPIKENVIYDNS